MPPRKRSEIEQAISALIATTAQCVKISADAQAEIARLRQQTADAQQKLIDRMDRFELILARLLDVLPEALRDKIGIKPDPA